MDTLLHGKLGYVLAKELKEKGHDISIGYFIYGNMLPDISPRFRFSMHTKNKNWNDVLNLMGDLVYKGNKLTSRSKSIKLGMITHYLCDFFTFPHNDSYTDSIIQHEIYEQIQRIKFWSYLEKLWKEYDKETNAKLNTFEDILTYIQDMHCIYSNNRSNEKRDLLFISILVRVVCPSLLTLMKGEIRIKSIETIPLKVSHL